MPRPKSSFEIMRQRLVAIATSYGRAKNLKLSSVGMYAIGDGNFFKRVDEGGKFTPDTHDRMMQYFADNWPDGTKRPAALPPKSKPRRSRKKADACPIIPEEPQTNSGT